MQKLADISTFELLGQSSGCVQTDNLVFNEVFIENGIVDSVKKGYGKAKEAIGDKVSKTFGTIRTDGMGDIGPLKGTSQKADYGIAAQHYREVYDAIMRYMQNKQNPGSLRHAQLLSEGLSGKTPSKEAMSIIGNTKEWRSVTAFRECCRGKSRQWLNGLKEYLEDEFSGNVDADDDELVFDTQPVGDEDDFDDEYDRVNKEGKYAEKQYMR